KDVPPYARNLPEMFYRYSPKSWADAKKYQLQWIQNPELYIDNKYPPFIRIE
ncbi:16000_t:CDS:2, partial [Entrophospora sp. SA101]